MMMWLLIAAVLLNDGVVKIEGEPTIDVARSTYLTVSPKGIDLRDRFRGFSLAEDFDDEKENCTRWKLIPEPCAKEYKIRPFAFADTVHGPVRFEPPAAREPVTGGMEIDPKKDLPPLSWKLVGWIVGALALLVSAGWGIWWLVRFLLRKIKEHRMSPIERAWVELDRLLKKGLPGRGRYKDFYVELTMVVRRYIQRKYGIRAPNQTTEEFLRSLAELKVSDAGSVWPNVRKSLQEFLESADLVKFAGVEATPEMADAATDSARGYLKTDSREGTK